MLLTLNNLCVRFKNIVPVRRANMVIHAGECVALIGPSGCGKTTLGRAILQLQSDATISGEVIFENQNLLTLNDQQMCAVRGGKISMIFQEPMSALNPLHMVGKQVMESLMLHHNIPTKQHVVDLFKMVDLKNPQRIFKSYPHELSGGERQRVLIAMALAGQPQLLIADEPTTALDGVTQTQILLLLKRLQKELNLAILFITHDLAVVKQLADRVYVMEDGCILDDKIPELPSFAKTHVIPDQEIVLDVYHLNVSYGKNHVIKNFDLQLHKGETIALVGPSGCGKSSIGFALARLIPATGQVLLNGQDFFALRGKALKCARSDLQMVFQDPFSSLNPRWLVKDIILEGARIHHIPDCERVLYDILNQVHLFADILMRYPHELSGGQRVRVALARALMLHPKVLILDEITTQLDIHTQGQIIDLLRELQEKMRLSYLFISHDERALHALSHRIISLSKDDASFLPEMP